jgi:hypothetical protein
MPRPASIESYIADLRTAVRHVRHAPLLAALTILTQWTQ